MTQYRAFFSYARTDDKLANWLHRQLDSYRTPKAIVGQDGTLGPVPAKLHPIFRDRTDLESGGHISQRLQDALEDSECLVVLCTPTSARSRWVNHECETFLRLGRENRIFPVIGAGEPNSGNPETECLPPALRATGLLAADLRAVRELNGQLIGDGRDGGRLKLLAGLLGVPLDQLVQRERQRQRRLIGTLGAAALVFGGVAVTAVVQTVVAIEQTRVAQENAREAEAATIEAQEQRDLAVNRLDFATEAPASVRNMLLQLDFRPRSVNSVLYGFDGFDAPTPCGGNAACSHDARSIQFGSHERVAVTWNEESQVIAAEEQDRFFDFCRRLSQTGSLGGLEQQICTGNNGPMPSYSKFSVFELEGGWWVTRLVGWSCGSRGCEDVFVVWRGGHRLQRALSCGGVSFAIRFDEEMPTSAYCMTDYRYGWSFSQQSFELAVFDPNLDQFVRGPAVGSSDQRLGGDPGGQDLSTFSWGGVAGEDRALHLPTD